MPVIGSAAALYFDGAEPLLRGLTLARLAGDALWTMSKLTCLEAKASERLQELPASLARADQTGRPDFFEAAGRLCVLPPSIIHGVCFCREYTRALRFRLDGRSVLLKGALPCKWRQDGKSYAHREVSLFGATPLQACRSAAEQEEAMRLAGDDDARACRPAERAEPCKPLLRAWLQEECSVKVALVVDALTGWKELEEVDARKFPDNGTAQLFALCTSLAPPTTTTTGICATPGVCGASGAGEGEGGEVGLD
eukprot:g46727.t1